MPRSCCRYKYRSELHIVGAATKLDWACHVLKLSAQVNMDAKDGYFSINSDIAPFFGHKVMDSTMCLWGKALKLHICGPVKVKAALHGTLTGRKMDQKTHVQCFGLRAVY